jgi:cysteine synthase A
MIEKAEADGLLKPEATVIEPTSGNTGIGIAAVCAYKGYRAIIVMPDTMSKERRDLMRAYGAEVVLTDGALGMSGAVKRANELQAEIPNSFIPSQFENKSNPAAHYKNTGPEIYDALDGKVDIFVSAVGTGGSISGIGKYLKSKISNVKIIAVEPKSSPLLSEGISGPHKIQGIGANFVPETLNRDIIDEIITVSDSDAYEFSKKLVECEGILTGISSGAALCAATILAQSEENKGKKIVVLLPDTGERYLSTPNFI